MAGWTYDDIAQKVRNVTGAPSTDQLSDSDLSNYINNYYVYSMPFELKEQIQLDFLDFFVFPGQSVYDFSDVGGLFLTDQPGAYADGFPLIFYQDPDIFYQDFPQQYATDTLATGDGTTTNFTGGLQNPPVIMGTLYITDGTQVVQDNGSTQVSQTIGVGNAIITNFTGTLGIFPIQPGSMSVTDGTETFVDNGAGVLTGSLGGMGSINYATGAYNLTFNTAPATGVSVIATFSTNISTGTLTGNGYGTINYSTGAYNVTFNNAPASSAQIYGKYQGYQANRPQGVLFFQNQFTFMPIPDQVYAIRMQGYVKPLEISTGETPTLQEWGQLIAYGASLDIFSDRGDMDSYNQYYPVLKRFENIALARTIQQYQAEQSVERF